MTIREFKQLVKEDFKVITGVIGFLVWILLISFSLIILVTKVPIWIKVGLIAITVVYTILAIININKSVIEQEELEKEMKRKKLQDLEIKYYDYISLVDKHIQSVLVKFCKNISDEIVIDNTHDYLISFSDKLDWICRCRIKGKPDSFIIASCFMLSLLKHPRITLKQSTDINKIKDIIFGMNIEIAINCAFDIISEPVTYYEDGNGKWIEEKHPKVNIVVPNGLIKNSELGLRIKNSILRDYYAEQTMSIMQFSNLLHLIYLNCK